MKAKLTFCAGVNTVTGANFLFEVDGKKILIDCGLTQGSKLADDINWEPFVYDPSSIDMLFVTHAHVDHIGRIPKLIHDGFKGIIYSTIPTKDIAVPMLLDTKGILERDHEHKLNEIYNEESLKIVFSLWKGIEYHKPLVLSPLLTIVFRDAGHILGSAMIEITYNGKKIVFTGDLGNSPSPILPDTEQISDATYLVMESVYGDRNHESRGERKKRLESIIEDNYSRKGTLVIPTFSLERSQELLFEINDLVENKRIPAMPIFFDSPLAIKLTALYQGFSEYLNEPARKLIRSGDDIFMFPGLKTTVTTEDSKMILKASDPKIVIAGSGMSTGGRIIHHEHNYLPDENSTLLLIGYQSMGTLGRAIEDGAKVVTIERQEVAVRAHIEKISGYSGHKDSDALLGFVEGTQETVQQIFTVMGEPKSSMFLVQRIRDYLGLNARAPALGEVVELEF